MTCLYSLGLPDLSGGNTGDFIRHGSSKPRTNCSPNVGWNMGYPVKHGASGNLTCLMQNVLHSRKRSCCIQLRFQDRLKVFPLPDIFLLIQEIDGYTHSKLSEIFLTASFNIIISSATGFVTNYCQTTSKSRLHQPGLELTSLLKYGIPVTASKNDDLHGWNIQPEPFINLSFSVLSESNLRFHSWLLICCKVLMAEESTYLLICGWD